jgi:hypothetical protein
MPPLLARKERFLSDPNTPRYAKNEGGGKENLSHL